MSSRRNQLLNSPQKGKLSDKERECLEGFNTVIGRINNIEIVGRHWSIG